MKTITLTKSEIETLQLYLSTNICSVGCPYNYTRIRCDDIAEDGTYRCKLMRDILSIEGKLRGSAN